MVVIEDDRAHFKITQIGRMIPKSLKKTHVLSSTQPELWWLCSCLQHYIRENSSSENVNSWILFCTLGFHMNPR